MRRRLHKSSSLIFPRHPFPKPASPRSRAAPWLCAALLVFATGQARAAFEILSGRTLITADAIVTEVSLDLSLNDTVVEAINEGIELHIVADLRLLRVRQWLWDEAIGAWQTGFRLKYHDLSSTYVLTDERSGELETFTTIRDAMDSLANLTISLPVVTETLPDNPNGYRASLRIDIDRDSLPPPLKLITEITPAWQLGSKWTQWTVAQ